jgi:hypothetical protein
MAIKGGSGREEEGSIKLIQCKSELGQRAQDSFNSGNEYK